MAAPADEFPVQLRDELFRLFAHCLGAAEAETRLRAGLEDVSRRAAGSWVKTAFLDDRAPRYAEALRQAAALKRSDVRYAYEVQVGRILFNQGLFFDCHEYLEPSWKEANGRERRSIQGLIQAGAGFHKLERGSFAGCAQLLKEAASKLAEAEGPGLKAFALELLEASEKAGRSELTPEQAPQLGGHGLEL